jgi:glycosyltransferase involved in cell wall biosynthesis
MPTDIKTAESSLPKVSIIIVTFNAAGLLQQCLNYIYKQTYPFLEIIVIDGGSKDGTVDILKANNDKIAFWKSEPDKGIYYAMNKALAHVTGEWVYFLGADDELFDKFSDLLRELKDPSAVYYGRVIIKNKETPGPVNAYKHAKDTICHQAIVYPALVFKKYQYNTKYPITADHLLNMQLWSDKNFHFEFVDLTIAKFNDTGISSTKIDKIFKKDQAALVMKHYGAMVWARYVFRKLKVMLNPDKYKSDIDNGN